MDEEKIREIISHMFVELEIECTLSDDPDEIPEPGEMPSDRKSLVVFDDIVNSNQKTPIDYFVRGRHNNVETIYLSQSFFELDKRLVRSNCNSIILSGQEPDTLTNIYRQMHSRIKTDYTKNEFEPFLENCWNEPYRFAYINVPDGVMYCGLPENRRIQSNKGNSKPRANAKDKKSGRKRSINKAES